MNTTEINVNNLNIEIVEVNESNVQKCLHDACPTCNGSGYDPYGGICLHGISCPCPKCCWR